MWSKLRKGMDEEEIKKALLKKAIGYDTDEIVEEYATDKDGNSVLVKRKITKKYNSPDISALKFLLEHDQLSDDEISKMSDEELLREKDRLLQLLREKEMKENENAGM